MKGMEQESLEHDYRQLGFAVFAVFGFTRALGRLKRSKGLNNHGPFRKRESRTRNAAANWPMVGATFVEESWSAERF